MPGRNFSRYHQKTERVNVKKFLDFARVVESVGKYTDKKIILSCSLEDHQGSGY